MMIRFFSKITKFQAKCYVFLQMKAHPPLLKCVYELRLCMSGVFDYHKKTLSCTKNTVMTIRQMS